MLYLSSTLNDVCVYIGYAVHEPIQINAITNKQQENNKGYHANLKFTAQYRTNK